MRKILTAILISGLIVASYLFGCRMDAITIQQSCDNENQEHTYINGHDYLCVDYGKFQIILQYLIDKGKEHTT